LGQHRVTGSCEMGGRSLLKCCFQVEARVEQQTVMWWRRHLITVAKRGFMCYQRICQRDQCCWYKCAERHYTSWPSACHHISCSWWRWISLQQQCWHCSRGNCSISRDRKLILMTDVPGVMLDF
jgi:hypothetical protein